MQEQHLDTIQPKSDPPRSQPPSTAEGTCSQGGWVELVVPPWRGQTTTNDRDVPAPPPRPHDNDEWPSTHFQLYEPLLVGWIMGACSLWQRPCRRGGPPTTTKAAWWRTTHHPSQPHEHLLMGWVEGRRPRATGGRGRQGWWRRPSSHPPPLRAFACRVEQVLIATSQPAGMDNNDDEWGWDEEETAERWRRWQGGH
jgi:hypothetical protein